MPQRVILDFDDFCQDQSALDLLFKMKAKFPKFKVNLFTIPMRCDKAWLDEVSKLEWISLIQHGWTHQLCENEKWSQHEAENYFRTAQGWVNKEGRPIFCKGYKAPNWRLNQNTVRAIGTAGLWLADNPDPASNPHGVVIMEGTKRYYFTGNRITDDFQATGWDRFHGHIGPMDCDNEINYIWHHLNEKIDADADFFFIEDVLDQLYAGT